MFVLINQFVFIWIFSDLTRILLKNNFVVRMWNIVPTKNVESYLPVMNLIGKTSVFKRQNVCHNLKKTHRIFSLFLVTREPRTSWVPKVPRLRATTWLEKKMCIIFFFVTDDWIESVRLLHFLLLFLTQLICLRKPQTSSTLGTRQHP